MLSSERAHLETLIDLSRAGVLTRSEVVAIAAHLRGHAEPGSMLHHLGCAILRDLPREGVTDGYLADFAGSAMRLGGWAGASLVLFDVHQVMDKFADLLTRLGVRHDRMLLRQQALATAGILGGLLAGTSFAVPKAGLVVRLEQGPTPRAHVADADGGEGLDLPLLVGHGAAMPGDAA